MRRKVIQIANSTQLVSLPRKWAIKYGIKKGDELEVNEEGNRLCVSTPGSVQLENIEIDVTGLDRTSILYCIESVYRLGFDQVKVIFNKPTAEYYRKKENVNVLSVLHYATDRMLGFEIVQQRDNFCLIKDVQEVSRKEFDTLSKRIMLLLYNAFEDLANGLKEGDDIALGTVKQKHNSITKFSSYALRLLNKVGYEDAKKNFMIYHIIASVDKIADFLKEVARGLKYSLNKEATAMVDDVVECFKLHYENSNKFNPENIHKISQLKDKFIKKLKKSNKGFDNNTIILLTYLASSLEVLTELMEASWALQY